MTDQTVSAPVSNEAAVASPNPISSTPESSTFDISKFYSDDLRKDPDFDRISKNFPNDPNALVKDLFHKTKHFGKARDVVKAELEAEFNKPAVFDPKDYQYELPENYSIEDELLDTAKAKATELGIKPEQFKEFMKSVFEVDAKTKLAEAQASKAADEEAITSLKTEWGANFEKRSANAERMLQFLTSPEDDAIIEKIPAQGRILLAKMMEKVSQKISEPSIGKIESAPVQMTQEIFQSKTNEIRSSKMTESEKTAQLNDLYSKFYSAVDMGKYYTKTTSRII